MLPHHGPRLPLSASRYRIWTHIRRVRPSPAWASRISALLFGLLLLPASVPAHALPLAQGQEGADPPQADGHRPDARLPGEIVGRVIDARGAALQGATVLLERNGELLSGVGTDRLGGFRIRELAPGTYRLRVERLGFTPEALELSVGEDRVRVEVVLQPSALRLEGISVEASRSRERTNFEREAGATVRELSAGELRLIPGLAETDPLRALEVLPGVVSTSDFASAFNVRGASADQNLILLDGIPIFNPFHLGGLFSVFNGDMVARAELRTGGFPAEYGARVSSVLNVESDPGTGAFQVDAGISLLATRVAVAGSLPEGVQDHLGFRTTRWRASARRSYVDILFRPVFDLPYNLQDLQGVFEGWTPGGGRFSITGYTGADILDLTTLDNEDFPLRVSWDWGNDVVGARFTQPRPGGGSVELRGGYSRFATGLLFPDFDDTDFRSRIQQTTLRAVFQEPLGHRWTLTGGVGADRLSYDNLAVTGGTEFGSGAGAGWLLGTHLQGEWRVDRSWLVEVGARVDGWMPEEEEAVTVPAPRVAVKRFFSGGEGAVKLAAGRYSQFLHSIRDEELPLGLDIWILTGARVPHVVSDQVVVGVEGFPRENWFASLEGYYRTFDGVVANNLAQDPNDPLDDLLRGDGTSYGADLLLRRDAPGVNGWLSLSWLRALRNFQDIFAGEDPAPLIRFPPVFDRRLDLDLVLQFPLPGGLEGGVRWSYGSGLPYTRPEGSYGLYGPRFTADGRLSWQGEALTADEEAPVGILLGPRNGVRYPAYHRMDASARKSYRRPWGSVTPYLDILNLYNRRNVLFYFYQYEGEAATRTGLSMFPVLPTFGVEVRF